MGHSIQLIPVSRLALDRACERHAAVRNLTNSTCVCARALLFAGKFDSLNDEDVRRLIVLRQKSALTLIAHGVIRLGWQLPMTVQLTRLSLSLSSCADIPRRWTLIRIEGSNLSDQVTRQLFISEESPTCRSRSKAAIFCSRDSAEGNSTFRLYLSLARSLIAMTAIGSENSLALESEPRRANEPDTRARAPRPIWYRLRTRRKGRHTRARARYYQRCSRAPLLRSVMKVSASQTGPLCANQLSSPLGATC